MDAVGEAVGGLARHGRAGQREPCSLEQHRNHPPRHEWMEPGCSVPVAQPLRARVSCSPRVGAQPAAAAVDVQPARKCSRPSAPSNVPSLTTSVARASIITARRQQQSTSTSSSAPNTHTHTRAINQPSNSRPSAPSIHTYVIIRSARAHKQARATRRSTLPPLHTPSRLFVSATPHSPQQVGGSRSPSGQVPDPVTSVSGRYLLLRYPSFLTTTTHSLASARPWRSPSRASGPPACGSPVIGFRSPPGSSKFPARRPAQHRSPRPSGVESSWSTPRRCLTAPSPRTSLAALEQHPPVLAH